MEIAGINNPVVLVIDDDPQVPGVVQQALRGVEHRMYTATDCGMGVREAVARRPDLVVLDNMLPDGLGVDLIEQIRSSAPNAPVLFMAAHESGNVAIEAMKKCAFDYLPKPLELTVLRDQIQRALALRQCMQEEGITNTKEPADPIQTAHNNWQTRPTELLIGECPAMQSVFKSIGKVANQHLTVLLRGESGTGKETMAHEIHYHSPQSVGPFIIMQLQGLEESRLEDELFGCVETDKRPQVRSRFKEAAGGTLLLQDVDCLPITLQARLLQAITDGTYVTAGKTPVEQISCRILGTTSKDLETRVRAGSFRQDLFYALSSCVISLPSLEQRKEDLPLLINHCLEKLHSIAKGFGVEQSKISHHAMKTLCDYTWPGNIDELQSVLKRALVEQQGHILTSVGLQQTMSEKPALKINDSVASHNCSTDWATFVDPRIENNTDTLHADAIEETERKLFCRVLSHTNGNQAQAARLLGITRTSLRKKLRLYGMSAQQNEN